MSEHGDDPYTVAVDGRHIASVKSQSAETSDNARLIAAAPELLAALEACVESLELHEQYENERNGAHLEPESPELQAAYEAIRKAKGE